MSVTPVHEPPLDPWNPQQVPQYFTPPGPTAEQAERIAKALERIADVLERPKYGGPR